MHESYGRLGKQAMELLNAMADSACAGGPLPKPTFIENALRLLSVGLCRGNGVMYSRSLGVFARASGRGFLEGSMSPTVEMG